MRYLLSYNIVTHPPDSLPPTIVQWCIVLSRSTICVVIVGIAATVVTAAAVALSSPAAPPDRQLHRRCHHHSPPPLPLPTAIGTSLASSSPPGAGTVAGAAIPGINDGAPPISDDQLQSPRHAPSPSCCVIRSSVACLPRVVHSPPSRQVVRLPHASHHPIHPPPLLFVSSATRPPRGNIATSSSLRRPPPPSRSLRAVPCRLLHAVSTRTSPPPLSTQHPPRQ